MRARPIWMTTASPAATIFSPISMPRQARSTCSPSMFWVRDGTAPPAKRRGRVVLPRDLLQEHGLGPAELLTGRPGPALRDAARELGSIAAGELAGARALARDIRRGALPVLVLARFCDAYLARIQRAEWDLFAAGIEPLPVTVPMLLIRAGISGRF
jgi:hypothetical protein